MAVTFHGLSSLDELSDGACNTFGASCQVLLLLGRGLLHDLNMYVDQLKTLNTKPLVKDTFYHIKEKWATVIFLYTLPEVFLDLPAALVLADQCIQLCILFRTLALSS